MTERMAELAAEFAGYADAPGRRMDLIRKTMDLVLDVEAEELERFLVDALEAEPDPIVRHEMVFVVGALVKFEFLRGDLALPGILRGAREERSTVVRHECVEALSNFPRMECVTALERALDDPVLDVSATAIISLERLTYQDQAPEVAAAAARVLAAHRSSASAPR